MCHPVDVAFQCFVYSQKLQIVSHDPSDVNQMPKQPWILVRNRFAILEMTEKSVDSSFLKYVIYQLIHKSFTVESLIRPWHVDLPLAMTPWSGECGVKSRRRLALHTRLHLNETYYQPIFNRTLLKTRTDIQKKMKAKVRDIAPRGPTENTTRDRRSYRV